MSSWSGCPSNTNKIPKCNALNPKKSTVFVYNDITHDTVWTSDKNWVLMNRINVINNSVLAIEEGTIVYANSPDFSDPRNPPSLIVTIGSKLFAEGSCKCPIIFTSILPTCEIFALNNRKNWTYNGGLGPFSALWSGIYVCGNNVTNLVEDGVPINLEGTSVLYGGSIGNTNNVVLSYVRIYFAGDASAVNSNSLTLAAPSYNCTLQNLEIMYGQGNGISVYGGAALIKDSVIAFKYKGNYVALKDGAQVSLVHNIYMDGFSGVDLAYQTDLRAFVYVESAANDSIEIYRSSVANLSASTFLSLGFIQYHVYTQTYGIFKSVNNVHIGPCTCVYSVPDYIDPPYPITFTTSCPSSFDQLQFYLGPIAYEQCGGVLYCGPAETFQNAYNESGQLLRKITYLTNGYNNELIQCGRFLNIAPVNTSDAFKSISTDNQNSHVLPFICDGFFPADPNLQLALLQTKKSFHASGAVETESDEVFWCTGQFGRFLTVCTEDNYNCCFNHYKPCTEIPDYADSPCPAPCAPCSIPVPAPHCPKPRPHCDSTASSSSCSSDSSISMDASSVNAHYVEENTNKMNDLITKGLVIANASVMGYFLLKTLNKSSKK